METTADKNRSLLGNNDEEQSVASALARAIEKISSGVLEEGHKILIRLIRNHHNDADVIFNLALARKRLGYDVSAEALFSQAFEHGYKFPKDNPAEPIEGKANHLLWTDPTGEVELEVWQRPRRAALTWVGFVEEDEHDDEEDNGGEENIGEENAGEAETDDDQD